MNHQALVSFIWSVADLFHGETEALVSEVGA